MKIGTVKELWRYPVKSMAGSRVTQATVDAYGMVGDRCWGLVESASGDIAWGKRFPKVMNLAARYVDEPSEHRSYHRDDIPDVAVTLPDGRVVTGAEAITRAVSDYVGTGLSLEPFAAPENREFYRWQTPADEATILKILGIGPDDPIPDLSIYDESVLALLSEHFAPPGTLHDMYPLHALSQQALDFMTRQSGTVFSKERFRPSILIDTDSEAGLPEFDWIGKKLRVGSAVLEVAQKTVRCSMPAREQTPYQLAQDSGVAKALNRETGRFLGIYLSVLEPGSIKENDALVLA